MQTFLHEIAKEIITKGFVHPHTIFILPSKRGGHFLKKILAEYLDAPVFSPNIVSIEDFVKELSQLESMSSIELLIELYAAYTATKLKNKDDFNVFITWASVLLQDFNEIDRHLVDTENLFSYLSEAKKLKSWNLDHNKTVLASNYLKFWGELQSIYNTFLSSLLKKGMAYQGLQYRKAYENIVAFLKETAYLKFVFIGFNALNTAETKIINHLLEHADTELYWDLDSHFLQDSIHAAGLFLRQYQRHWPYFQNHGLQGISSHYAQKKNITITGVPKNIAQAKYVGKLLQAIYRPEKKMALVLSDESLLEPVVKAIPSTVTDINITMGKSIQESLLHSFFNNLFELKLSRTDSGFFYGNLISTLSNPYLQQLYFGNHHNLNRLVSTIKESNNSYIGLLQLQSFFSVESRLLKTLFETDDITDFIDSCFDSLQTLQQNSTLSHIEKTTINLFKNVFQKLSEYVQHHSFINNFRTLQGLYKELVLKERLDYRGNPHQGLQIMGMLETRNLDFETVIITSVNEGILPSGKSNNSFIPYDIKREFNMPTYREKDAIYTYHFYHLLQRAKNIFIVYNTEPDVLEGGEKSRFITQIMVENLDKHEIKHRIATPEIHPQAKKIKTIEKTPLLMQALHKLASKGFSPSSLSDYIRNPITFYERYILKIEQSDELKEDLAANTFGTLVHDVLENFYKPFKNTSLQPQALKAAKKRIKTLLEQSFSQHVSSSDYRSGKLLLIYNAILKYLNNYIDHEMEQAKAHDIYIMGLETQLKYNTTISGNDILIKGKLDRIDTFDGQLRIIDYKTGKVINSEIELMDWDALITDHKHAKAFQLLCYAKMYFAQDMNGASNLEAGIIPIKKTDPSLMRFAIKNTPRGPKNHQVTPETIQLFDQQLEKLVREILNPNSPFLEKDL